MLNKKQMIRFVEFMERRNKKGFETVIKNDPTVVIQASMAYFLSRVSCEKLKASISSDPESTKYRLKSEEKHQPSIETTEEFEKLLRKLNRSNCPLTYHVVKVRKSKHSKRK